MKLELCIDTFEGALVASQYGFDRLELCSALETGGLTPSAGLIKICTSIPGIETHVMIRPRGGGFAYSRQELSIMEEDIRIAANLGAKGVVFGILNASNDIDSVSCLHLMNIIRDLKLEATFHRAFDLVINPNEALLKIIDLGFHRLLTSGQHEKAIDGIQLIQQLINTSKNRIQIMAGSGINFSNAPVFKGIGVDALHFTAKKATDQYSLNMGTDYLPDTEKIEQILKALQKD